MSTATLASRQDTDRSFWQRNQQSLAPWLFLTPALLFFLFYVVYPIFQSFNLSLYEWDGLGQAEYIGLRNYEDLYYEFINRDAFYVSLKNKIMRKLRILFPFLTPSHRHRSLERGLPQGRIFAKPSVSKFSPLFR